MNLGSAHPSGCGFCADEVNFIEPGGFKGTGPLASLVLTKSA